MIEPEETTPLDENEFFRCEMTEEQLDLRLDHWLATTFPSYSRSLWQKAIAAGQVCVNEETSKPSYRLQQSDVVSGKAPQHRVTHIEPTAIDLDIIYEDEHLAVVNKPANLIVHPGKANYSGTLANALVHHFETLSETGGEHRPGIVHRLDRDTTGVIIIARNNAAHEKLSKQFADRTVEKEYRAIAWGKVNFDSDYIETYVRQHARIRERMIVCSEDPEARHASTYYEVLERFRNFTYLKLLPKTGRTHQLRVHLQHIKHSIAADRLYGGQAKILLSDLIESKEHFQEDAELISRQALHAHRLCVDHPATGKRIEFTAPLPQDMQTLLNALREHSSLES